MNLSSRWCVTAVVALGALGCSDPVPPPAQGAFVARITSVSPAPNNKSCPSGAALSFDVPSVADKAPLEALDENTYLQKVIDGADGAAVSCTVKGNGASFEARLSLAGKTLEISSGTLGADQTGTARISVQNSQKLSGSLSSPMADCRINAKAASGNNFQAAPGHMWGSFECTSVERQPSDYCAAKGIFVLENCAQ